MTGGLTITTSERTVKATMRNKSAREMTAKIHQGLEARTAVGSAGGQSAAEQLATYADLPERGLMTREEFDTKKSELL